jgi:glyoxylase-like metal-dependent hydrolase (beta-lactamase superfamily II)
VKVGDLDILPVLDGTAEVDPSVMLTYRGDKPDAWAGHEDLLTPDGRLEMSLGGFLVRAGERLVLVDAGIGALDTGLLRGGAMLDNLAGYGVSPADVTDVVFTHLHFDHVGWASRRGQVVFTNATYRCHTSDWAHFVTAPGAAPGAVRKLSPIEPQLELFDGDVPIAPGVDVRLTPGHTPGSTVVVVSSGAERAMLLGDVVHCPVELLEDEWEMVADVDAALAARTREALARELAGSSVPVAAAHFPGLRFGRLLAGSSRRMWSFGPA